MNSPLDPWLVSSDQSAKDGTSEEKLWFALQYAILAPSSHNSQPWRFKIQNNVVDLYSDLTRRLPIVDPDDRQLIMSCGAALEHLRIAIGFCGNACGVEPFPDPERPTLLARTTLGYHQEAVVEDTLLFNAIPKRRTNRKPFSPDPIPLALLESLSVEALNQGCWLHVVEGDESRVAIADLVAEADRVQWHDKHFRAELAHWLHPNRAEAKDGIPGYAEGLGNLASDMGPMIVRTFDIGKGQAAKDREIALHSPTLAVLGTTKDDPASWLDAGRALARVLLRARVEDVWASFLNQPIEVAEMRGRLANIIEREGHPQMLLRLGFGSDVKPTPRRGLKEVVIHEQHGTMKLA